MKPLIIAMVMTATTALGADALRAQRGGRGPPAVVTERLGAYFVSDQLPERSQDTPRDEWLAAVPAIAAAIKAKQLSVLYLYDPTVEDKHETFERTLFGNQDANVGLRCFRCVRIDIAGVDPELDPKLFEQAPLFVAFDATGKLVGHASMKGYKASGSALEKLLAKTAKKHVKPSFEGFVKGYRRFLNDLTVLESRKRTLQQKEDRLRKKPKPKLDEVDKDRAKLEKEEAALFEAEAKMLTKAKIPERDPNAVQLGRRRGR